MIERHITFSVHQGCGAEFERFFADVYRPAMARSAGFVSVGLLREMDHPSRYQMVLRFEDAEAATGWRTSQAHQALQSDLNTLHTGMEIVAYDVLA